MRHSLLILLLSLLVLAFSQGCVWIGFPGEVEGKPYVERIIVSNDNRQAAYVWTDIFSSLIPFPPWYPICPLAEARTEYVGWRNEAGRNMLARIKSDSAVGGYGNLQWTRALAFSPDGQRLAVGAENRIVVLRTDTGQREAEFEAASIVRDIRWLNNNEMVYCFVGWDLRIIEKDRLTIRRQPLGGRPKDVYVGKDSPHWWSNRLFFSRDGKKAIVCDQPNVFLLDCLNGQTARLAPLEGSDSAFDFAAWKPDDSGVFFKLTGTEMFKLEGFAPGEDTGLETNNALVKAMLVDREGRARIDLTKRFREEPSARYLNWATWTADGYLLTRGNGAALIRPEPWEVLRLDQTLKRTFSEDGLRQPAIRPLCAGWVAVTAKDGKVTAIRYDGKKSVPLGNHPFAVSADGTTLGEVFGKGDIRIRKISLPRR